MSTHEYCQILHQCRGVNEYEYEACCKYNTRHLPLFERIRTVRFVSAVPQTALMSQGGQRVPR